MDNLTVQSPAALLGMMQGMQGLGGVSGMGMGDGLSFMDLLMQMLSQTQDGALAPFLGLGGDQNQGEGKDKQQLLMAQLLGGLLATDNMAYLLMQQADPANVADIAQAISGMDGQSAQDLLAALQEAQQTAKAPEKGAEGDQNREPFEILAAQAGGEGKAASSGGDALALSAQFRSAVTEAQRMMRKETPQQGPDSRGVDVDALQGQVNAGRYAPEVSSKAELPPPQAKDVAEQVRQGIVQNLSKGKSEFVVKLKPAGLGEITVHLAESGGKIALSIVANSQQTARLLNSEIEGLRDSLRPMGAEVREVVTPEQQHRQEGGGTPLRRPFRPGQGAAGEAAAEPPL